MSRGSKSRNKVSVGEPAEGSLSNTRPRPRRRLSNPQPRTKDRVGVHSAAGCPESDTPGPATPCGSSATGEVVAYCVLRATGAVSETCCNFDGVPIRPKPDRPSARPVVGRGSSRTSWTRFSIRSSMFVRPARFKESCGTRGFSPGSVQVSGRRQPPEEAGSSRPARSPRRHLVFLTSV